MEVEVAIARGGAAGLPIEKFERDAYEIAPGFTEVWLTRPVAEYVVAHLGRVELSFSATAKR